MRGVVKADVVNFSDVKFGGGKFSESVPFKGKYRIIFLLQRFIAEFNSRVKFEFDEIVIYSIDGQTGR